MLSITPDPSSPDSYGQRSSSTAASVLLTPPSKSTHTCKTDLFCCDLLYPLTRPLGSHEQAIYHFAYYMVNIVSAPTERTYLPAALSIILEQTNYVIRFERWMNGEKDEIRHFIPHPKQNTTFIELMPSTLAASSRKKKWVPNLRYLKFRCDLHEGPWYTCFVLERREEEQILEVRSIKRKRDVELDAMVNEDLNTIADEPPYTPTHKIVKRRRV
ncbi:hypothetical protein BKA65DRAFT_555362 [Rhexocercosporidium sp. MPI-PUGE-AT-0058]|nr:hypothetical protein BKA65DRAFT_555362 [Rhexocercosporidium sp. MPI-PUGE-AT-0058]